MPSTPNVQAANGIAGSASSNVAGANQRRPQPSATGIAASSWMGAAPAEYNPPYPGEDGYGPAAPADPATH
eukprot:10497341-Prorocentrum_lima.AAC.1